MTLATPLSSFPAAPLQWLWHPRIPLGKLTLLAADPGLGKTALALHLAAALSTGAPLETRNPKFETPPAATLLLSPHDSTADTLRPRLDAMGADPHHIHLLPNFHSLTPSRLSADQSPLTTLENVCRSIPNLALLVIDPITHFLGLTDHAASPDTRSTLHALSQLAESLNIAILLTTRLTKKLPPLSAPSLPALHRTLGSLAFATAARTTLLILPYDPPTPSSPLTNCTNTPVEHARPNRLLLTLKSNLTALPPPLPFTLTQTLTFHNELDPAAFAPKLPPKVPDKESFLADACAFLQRYLAEGPRKSANVQAAATQNGISIGTLRRAKILLNLDTRFEGSRHAWFWCLKGDLRPIPTVFEEMEKNMRTLRILPAIEAILKEGNDL